MSVLRNELGNVVTALARASRALRAQHVQLANDIAEGDIGPRHAIYCSGLLHACLQTAATLDASKGLRAISNNRLTCTADHLPPRPAGMPPHAHFIALIFGKKISPSAAILGSSRGTIAVNIV